MCFRCAVSRTSEEVSEYTAGTRVTAPPPDEHVSLDLAKTSATEQRGKERERNEWADKSSNIFDVKNRAVVQFYSQHF